MKFTLEGEHVTVYLPALLDILVDHVLSGLH
jgi:hypothetical protein